jgi:hypothetical protein
MLTFFRDGGIASWWVLLFGGTSLIGAVLFARRPDEARLGFLRAMSWTLLSSMFCGFIAGVAKCFDGCARLPPEMRDRLLIFLLKGTSEAAAVLILGFMFLTLTWLIIAIGLRRLAARERAGA